MKRLSSVISICGVLILLSAPRAAHAIFHLMVIDEIMTSYGGDPNVQFVECKMLAPFQAFVTNTVLGAFGPTGTYLGDVLIVPTDLGAAGPDVRWIMATQAFEDLTGLTPDYIIPPNLPLASGMICWGAPGSGLVPAPDPNSWNHTDPNQYTDCVAYGSYSGTTNAQSGNPTPLLPVGHSLERISQTEDNETDFRCGDPATPENNIPGESASLAATTSCPSIPVLPGWSLPLLLALFTGAGALLLLHRRTALGPALPLNRSRGSQ